MLKQFTDIGKILIPTLPKDALVEALKQAAALLMEVEESSSQETVTAMKPCTEALVLPALLRHKDEDVRLLVATCVSEVIRIVAPEAPYEDDILKGIFQLIFAVFQGLDDMSSPSFSRRVHILETLAKVRSCVVMLDLECDDLILEMFYVFFNTASEEHPQNVFVAMRNILAFVIEESEEVSQPLLEAILNNISKDNKDVSPAAHKLAVAVAERCADELEPYFEARERDRLRPQRETGGMPPAGRQANERCMSLQEGCQQLLPGIPDEITLHKIIPKLPWKAFYILSSVSRAWLHGIRTRQVYDARVLSRSAETLVTVHSERLTPPSGSTTVCLCSLRERSVTKLPPIPFNGYDCHWVSLDGKIYLLAGEKGYYRRVGPCSNKVFVFDVAGQRQWKECASMNQKRTQFGCGVLNGKIYVFGGLSSKPETMYPQNPFKLCGSEVYDPKEDRWSPIRPMTVPGCDHRVLTVGDELFVFGGRVFDPEYIDSRKIWDDDDDEDDDDSSGDSNSDSSDDSSNDEVDDMEDHTLVANFLEVYNPVKDEWRVVNPFGRDSRGFLFTARGKLYLMDGSSIHVYDAKDNTWTHLHSVSFPMTGRWPEVVILVAVVAMDDELLVSEFNTGDFQSKGFGSESEEIILQKSAFVTDLFMFESFPKSSNRLIQL